MRSLGSLSLALISLAIAATAPEASACTGSKRGQGAISGSSSYRVTVGGVPSQHRSKVLAGATKWNQECPSGGFPEMTTAATGGTQRTINFTFQNGYQPDGSADACGEFFGNTVVLYEFARNEFGQTVPCMRADILEDTAAHEIGHVLGLNDSGCGNYMMGGISYNSGSYTPRAVRPAECSTLDETHMTPQEIADATEEEGGPEDSPPNNPPSCDDALYPCSPLIIDLDGRGFRFTSAAGGTSFDIDRDGTPEQIAWTRPGTGDGWLAVDRNGNGRIDDGGELFGNFSDQPATEEPNGYLALAVYDDDGDRRITAADSVFEHLRLWIDANQDGVSQPGELVDLASAEIEWIGLRYFESRRRDHHGNEYRYRGLVGKTWGMTHSVDVFLQMAP